MRYLRLISAVGMLALCMGCCHKKHTSPAPVKAVITTNANVVAPK